MSRKDLILVRLKINLWEVLETVKTNTQLRKHWIIITNFGQLILQEELIDLYKNLKSSHY